MYVYTYKPISYILLSLSIYIYIRDIWLGHIFVFHPKCGVPVCPVWAVRIRNPKP